MSEVLVVLNFVGSGQVAQLVEQRTENPCVGSSILPLGTILLNDADTAASRPGTDLAPAGCDLRRYGTPMHPVLSGLYLTDL